MALIASASLAVAIAPQTAKADVVALSVTGGTPVDHDNDNDLGGWEFTTNASIDVTALGIEVPASQNHYVGIYSTSGQLLVGETVSASGVSQGSGDAFIYTTLNTPQLLRPGTYVIAEYYPGDNPDPFLYYANTPSTASQVQYGGVALFVDSSNPAQNQNQNNLLGPSFLTQYEGNAFFGPNFEFTAVTVPEPGTLTLIGFGLIGMVRLRRKS